MPGLFSRWPDLPEEITEPVRALAYRNGMANLKLHAGDPRQARAILAKGPHDLDDDSTQLALAYRTMLLGLSHLWEGDAYQAVAILEPALEHAEKLGGRRSMVSCLHASVLAAAMLERGQPTAAEAILANRLDMIERTGFPDTILFAYRTLAYAAMDRHDERRALDLLRGLDTLAEHRRLPRLRMHSLAEQMRVHAIGMRTETVDILGQHLDALAPQFEQIEFQPYVPQYKLAVAIANAHGAIAKHDLDSAAIHLRCADTLAQQLNRRRDQMTIRVLRAVHATNIDPSKARALLSEAMGLATIGGHVRLLADTHPLAVRMAEDMQAADTARARAVPDPETRVQVRSGDQGTPLYNGPLTPKEAAILKLLNKNMSNKMIARALDISDETVKWHLKNVFLKLSAGTRKHAVDRARLLGLALH